MKQLIQAAGLILLVTALAVRPAAAAPDLDAIGMTGLRAVATNVDGGGIRVAQPEASAPTFEVNPAAVSQPTNLFRYTSAAGTDTNFPNSAGTESYHADEVGGNFYGLTGVATNVAHVDNFDADYFINYYVVSNLAVLDAVIVNQSFTYRTLSVSDQQQVDSAFDDYTAVTGTLFVSAACNSNISIRVCAPGTAYNCISVASYKGNSSIGPTIDNGRCKPDITAPYGGGGTSFTTPQVAGAAAVLMQAALAGAGGGDTNSAFDRRTIKALLLNGAVKPLDWTNANDSPLDARYGAGILNVLNSYEQLIAGEPGGSVVTSLPLGSAHPPLAVTNFMAGLSGWDFTTNATTATNDCVSHHLFNVTNAAGSAAFSATITLAWDRQQGQTNINDLDLFLFESTGGGLVACSTSRVDNVEHIFVPQLPAGCYDLQVLKNGGPNTVSDAEAYALAWEFIAPTLQISGTGTNATLTWPVYPAGFLVESATNLTAGAWSTNGFPAFPAITNGQYSLPLSTTNDLQFFRLRKPDQ